MISNMGHVMTLANSIIGVGILAMPFCFQKCGIILSILLLVVNYLVTRISCHYLIKSSILTRRKSFEYLAFYAFGLSGKLMVELCIIGYLIGTCIAYFVVVGDLGPQIVAKLLNINQNDNLRTYVMIIVTFLCIIPLGMLKNVDSLSTVCTASIGFYFCLVLKVIAESKMHIVANDWIDHIEYWRPAGILQCVPIFSMALSCQMQLFEVFESVPNQSLEKMNLIVKNATRICTCGYILVGLFGYIAFCNQTFSGNILVNFSQSLTSDAIKMGFVISVAFSFPLVIFPCRVSIYSLLYKRGQSDAIGYIPERRFKTITVCITVVSLCVGLLIPSIELVIGLVGSTIGVAICIMFPASCFLKISKKESAEKSLAQIILICGFCLMILGTYANLNAIDEKRSGTIIEKIDIPHLELINQDNSHIIPEIKIVKLKDDVDHQKKLLLIPNDNALKEKQIELKSNEKNLSNVQILNKAAAKNVNIEVKKPNIISTDLTQSLPKNQLPELQKDTGNVTIIDKNLNNVINKDAIKKDEEVAAEEANKDKDLRLQNTELELKETKKLLEQTVDELKLELAKKNQETQNLMVAKLDDIVEKVEEIERQVLDVNKDEKKRKNENEILKDVSDKKLPSNVEIKNEKIIQNESLLQNTTDIKPNIPLILPKESLIGRMTENRKEKDKIVEIKEKELRKETPYEPLSYKTGEMMNAANKVFENLVNKNGVALPLPLLLNSTKVEINEILNQEIKIEKIKEKQINDTNAIKTAIKSSTEHHEKSDAEKERENIEAIRRDILSVKSVADNRTLAIREKREIQTDLSSSVLNKPKIDDLLEKRPIQIEDIKYIGRDLKSSIDEEN